MNTEPSEREEAQERLKRIRLRNASRRGGVNRQPTALQYAEAIGDVDELLSLYDAQASLIEDFRHNRIGDELQRVAEGARGRCVTAIRSLRHKSEPDDSRWNVALYHAEKTLESLTLEGKKEQ